MRLRGVVEVNVAVTLGLACEGVLFRGAGIACALRFFGGNLAPSACVADLKSCLEVFPSGKSV